MRGVGGGDGVIVRRDPGSGTNSVIVTGPSGVLVIDAGGDLVEAGRILADIDREIGRSVRALLLTHAHWDHSFGMAAFADRGAIVIGHSRLAAHHAAHELPRLAAWAEDRGREPDRLWDGVRLTAPDVEIEERRVLDSSGAPSR